MRRIVHSPEAVRAAYEGGARTAKQMSVALRVSKRTGTRMLNRLNPDRPKPPPPGASPEQIARIIQLAKEGLPTAWISEDVGLGWKAVDLHRSNAGLSGPSVKDRIWPQIRWRPELVELHREFAPGNS